METLGKYLRAQREKAGVKIETVARETKIRLSLLQDLENDCHEKLPQGVFLRGYVRAYTDSLRIRSERALELLEMASCPTVQADIVDTTAESASDEAQSSPTSVQSRRRWAAALVAVLLLGLAAAWAASSSDSGTTRAVSRAQPSENVETTTEQMSPLGPQPDNN